MEVPSFPLKSTQKHSNSTSTAVIVSLEASVFYIDESEGFVEVCAEADHQFETSFEVIIQTADSEALGESLT